MPPLEAPGFPPTMPMKASGPLELPPIASAPTALKARAPAMRSPVRDTLVDERMIIFPSLVLEVEQTVFPVRRLIDACREIIVAGHVARIGGCHFMVTAQPPWTTHDRRRTATKPRGLDSNDKPPMMESPPHIPAQLVERQKERRNSCPPIR